MRPKGSMIRKMGWKLLWLGIVVLVAWGGLRIYYEVSYTICCGGRLKRAADANTVPIALQELTAALTGIEARSWTIGYTSLLWRTPSEDVGFWYRNLVASKVELSTLSANASSLERSNMLMKLRETLLDTGQTVSVTTPYGVAVYPNNWAFCLAGLFGSLLAGVGALLLERTKDEF